MPDFYSPGDRVRNAGFFHPDLPIGTPGVIAPDSEGEHIFFIPDQGAVPDEHRMGHLGFGWALYANEVEPLVAAE